METQKSSYNGIQLISAGSNFNEVTEILSNPFQLNYNFK